MKFKTDSGSYSGECDVKFESGCLIRYFKNGNADYIDYWLTDEMSDEMKHSAILEYQNHYDDFEAKAENMKFFIRICDNKAYFIVKYPIDNTEIQRELILTESERQALNEKLKFYGFSY